jgi:hypothetical protein
VCFFIDQVFQLVFKSLHLMLTEPAAVRSALKRHAAKPARAYEFSFMQTRIDRQYWLARHALVNK